MTLLTKLETATLTVEEYLVFEEAQLEDRHEYIDGEIFLMPGVTDRHSAIQVNVLGALYMLFSNPSYSLRTSSMQVKVSDRRYVYPDLSVVYGKPLLENKTRTLLNPIMTVEVTSPSSMYYDRGQKRDFYASIPSLQVYLIVDQHRVHVEACRRVGADWQSQAYSDIDDVIALEPLGCDLPLADIYRNISFE